MNLRDGKSSCKNRLSIKELGENARQLWRSSNHLLRIKTEGEKASSEGGLESGMEVEIHESP